MKPFFLIPTFILFAFGRVKSPSPDLKQPVPVEQGIRMYILDGGTLENINPALFGLAPNEVSANRLPCPVFLVVHAKGVLLWDAGSVPDSSWQYTGSPVNYKLVLPDRQRDITLLKPLKAQLSGIGYTPSMINYLALSHYHYDHTGNANEFTRATWLVNQKEYDVMFGETAPPVSRPSTYRELKNTKKVMIRTDEYDVFGDGTVIIKSAPGHTPGHMVLLVKLPKTGNILLSGDLYHYKQERTLDRVPTFEHDAAQTRTTRKVIDHFIETSKAQLWIQHDPEMMSSLKKAPLYYE